MRTVNALSVETMVHSTGAYVKPVGRKEVDKEYPVGSAGLVRLIQDQDQEIKALTEENVKLKQDLRQTLANLETAHVDFRELARQTWEKIREGTI